MIIVKSLQIFLNWFVGFEEDICEDNLFGLLSKYKCQKKSDVEKLWYDMIKIWIWGFKKV